MPSILFVDDNNDHLIVLGILLEQQGFSVTTYSSAAEALNEANRQHFDVVLCDLRMPEMSGEDFLRAYREELGKQTPGVILSAEVEAIDESTPTLPNTRYCNKENCSRNLLRHLNASLVEKENKTH